MKLHGQINAACESRPGHPQPCHWSVWIVLECGFHKMDFSSCNIMLDFGKSSHIFAITNFHQITFKSIQRIIRNYTYCSLQTSSTQELKNVAIVN